MNWITQANGFIALLSGAMGFIGTCTGVFFAIKTKLKSLKDKSTAEIWSLLMSIADKAMQEASYKFPKLGSGAERREFVLNLVQETCLAEGIGFNGLTTSGQQHSGHHQKKQFAHN